MSISRIIERTDREHQERPSAPSQRQFEVVWEPMWLGWINAAGDLEQGGPILGTLIERQKLPRYSVFVELRRSNHTPIPRYQIVTGTWNGEKSIPFIKPQIDINPGGTVTVSDIFGLLAKMIEVADGFVRVDVAHYWTQNQEHVERIAKAKTYRQMRDQDAEMAAGTDLSYDARGHSGPRSHRRTGKTARERAKKQQRR